LGAKVFNSDFEMALLDSDSEILYRGSMQMVIATDGFIDRQFSFEEEELE